MIELKPLRKADAKSVTQAFEELILFRWETPKYLLCDNGKAYDNNYLRFTLAGYGIKVIYTPPYHAQSNVVERCNRTLKTMVKIYLDHDHRNWDLHLHEFRHAVNTAIHKTVRVSPAFLNYVRQPQPVKSLRREAEDTDNKPKLVYDLEAWKDCLKKLDALRDLVALYIDNERDKQKTYYDKNRKDVRFEIGDEVMRKSQLLSSADKHFCAKLAP